MESVCLDNLILTLVVAFALSACGGGSGAPTTNSFESTTDQELLNILLDVGDNSLEAFILPESDDLSAIPQDVNNPLTKAKVSLGQQLFHDTFLAQTPIKPEATGTYSCAACHNAGAGFQAARFQGLGEGGVGFGSKGELRQVHSSYADNQIDAQPFRSPSVLHSAFQEVTLWNGQFGAVGLNAGTEASWTVGTPKEKNFMGLSGIETQAIAGLEVHRLNFENSEFNDHPKYQELFRAAFPQEESPVNLVNAGLAIAAYERTLMANQAPFQEWLKGNSEAMTELQKQGALVFFSRGQCVECHYDKALGSREFHALGMNDLDQNGYTLVGTVKDADRKGRGGFTGQPEDFFKFKVPQLYNLKDSPFYGHGASFKSIESIVRYKNAGVAQNSQVPSSNLSGKLAPLDLSETEIVALTAFLSEALYDPNLMRYQPTSSISGQPIIVAEAGATGPKN